MQKIINAVLAVLLLAAIGVYLCCFEVAQGWVAVGSGNHLYAPGLQMKWPWQKIKFLEVQHQVFALQTTGEEWAVVAQVSQPLVYVQNNQGQSVADLIHQAWAGGAANLQQAPLLLKNGITVETVLQTGVHIADADQVAINQKMQGLFAQISQHILSQGEAQAQTIRTTAEANFLATQQQALDLAAQVTGVSQAAAVKMLSPLYEKNPALFKAYMQARAQILKNITS